MEYDMDLIRRFLDYSSGSHDAKILNYCCKMTWTLEAEYWMTQHAKVDGQMLIRGSVSHE